MPIHSAARGHHRRGHRDRAWLRLAIQCGRLSRGQNRLSASEFVRCFSATCQNGRRSRFARGSATDPFDKTRGSSLEPRVPLAPSGCPSGLATVWVERRGQFARGAGNDQRRHERGGSLLSAGDQPDGASLRTTDASRAVSVAKAGTGIGAGVAPDRSADDHRQRVRLRGECYWPCLVAAAARARTTGVDRRLRRAVRIGLCRI